MEQGISQVMTDLVLLVTKKGHYQEFEQGAINDLLNQQVNRLHLNLIFPETIVSSVLSVVNTALNKGAVHMITYTLGVGSTKEYYQAKAIPVHDECALLLIQNITEHEENKITLGERNALLQAVLDNIATEITVFDNNGQVTLRNKASITNDWDVLNEGGYEYNAIKFKKDGKTQYNEEEMPLVRAFKGESISDEIILKKAEGQYPLKTYLVSAVPLSDDEGQTHGVLMSERDISDITNAQFKLKSKVKDFDMFMYRVSHDLKSPLASMKGVLDFASHKIKDAETRTYLSMLHKSHTLLATIVNDLISLTRISQKEIENSVICVNKIINDIASSLQLMPQAAGIKFKMCAKDGITILTDEGMLRAVLQNLICNAFTHHRSSGDDRFVLVTVLEQEDTIQIEITDNGLGIAKNNQEKIFDIFFRGNFKAAGTGLGLFIVKQAIERMSGNLELVSEEGAGTTFYIIIPKIKSESK